MIELTDSQIERFSRQIILPEIGAARQQTLLHSQAVLVCKLEASLLAASYLAAGGVGMVRLVIETDDLPASWWNLLRESQPPSAARSRPRAREKSLTGSIARYNPDTRVTVHSPDETSSTLANAGVCIVLATQYCPALGKLCHSLGIPLLWGEARSATLVAGVDTPGGVCWQCAVAATGLQGPQGAELPFASVAAGLLASILAAEAIKTLAGLGSALTGRVLLLDTLSMVPKLLAASPKAGCPVCGKKVEQV